MHYNFKYRKLAEILYEALRDDAFYRTMEKSVDNGSSREAMIRYYDYSMVEAESYGELCIPDNNAYGVSVWARPLTKAIYAEKSERKNDFLRSHMGVGSLEAYNTIVCFMSGKSKPLIDERSWYLSIIGVLPKLQGQGLGLGLVENALNHADKRGIPTYLETFSPRNITFYNRLGYQALAVFHEPTTDAKYWIMARDVRNNKPSS